MSAGALYQEALRVLRRMELPDVAERDVLATLEAGQPGPLPLFYEAGAEAGLPRPVLLSRGVGLFFCFCAGNLADDLIDGECTYHAQPVRVGPCVQFLLQNLAFATLAGPDARVPAPVLADAMRTLALAAGPQALEVRAREWTAPLFRQVAEGIAGQQWEAYLRVLWAGSVLEPRAPEAGRALGVAAHVVEDIRSRDVRFTSMPPEDRNVVVGWARGAVQALRRHDLRCLDAALRRIEPILPEVES
ncbi:hypothetical protein HPC49_09230 [Pyxidicoccus fallax]|uniref:Uncharacterized protein n=1 Tax=Pyxidicoccus fallax TaxID=394095 RepID=A0A848L9P7_9BACT|nr:hypothetical protein [Pyxidicoccus fallax]NMO15297.1 hypothetical protein [Pyxidicoccus fallax]NPC78425.1 hypothetical protein [Pyxidicoccus fallax]